MNNSFKKIFFSSLLTVLFIVSNLIGLKYTNFLGLVVSVNFITYPFIILCVLLLMDLFGRKDTYNSITTTIFIQVFILLSYTLAINLGNQSLIPDMASQINAIFLVDEYSILASLIGFMISNYVLIYIYDYFRLIGKKLLGVILGTLFSLVVYGLLFISISNYSFGIDILLNLLLCHVIMSLVMTVVITIVFYLLKDKDNIHDKKNVFVNEINVKIPDSEMPKDMPIVEVISRHDVIKKKKNKKKNTTNNSKNEKKSKQIDKKGKKTDK